MAVKVVTDYIRKGIGQKPQAIEDAVSAAAAANPALSVTDVCVRSDSEGGIIVATTLTS